MTSTAATGSVDRSQQVNVNYENDNGVGTTPDVTDECAPGSFGCSPSAGLAKIEAGKTIKVDDFGDKGREILTNGKSENNFRLQYSLRLYQKRAGGKDIGNYGAGGWGGDGIIGKDCKTAIRHIMKQEGLSYKEAKAFVLDWAHNQVGIRDGKRTDPNTLNRVSKSAAWSKGPKPKTNNEKLMAENSTFEQDYNNHKYGANKAKAERVWSKRIEPLLRKHNHSDKSIAWHERKFDRIAKDYKKLTSKATPEEEKAASQKITNYVSWVDQRESRYTWGKAIWTKEIYPALSDAGVSKSMIRNIRSGFLSDARKYAKADSAYELTFEKDGLLSEKKYYLDYAANRKRAEA